MKKKHRINPNLLIIGAAATATGSLTTLIGMHPEAGIARGEQPNFFSHDDCYGLGWKKYLKLFEHCKGKAIIGDASVAYSMIRPYPKTVERVKASLACAKILYMVRHPLERMEHAYVERMYSPTPMLFSSVNDAVRRQPLIVDSSRYWEVFDAYCNEFPESQVKVVWLEDYIERTTEVFQDVCRFLEIDDTVTPDMTRDRANPLETVQDRMTRLRGYDIKVDTAWEPETRQWAINQIREDNCRFLQHFGKPTDHWGNLFG